jgi:O-methyltransferase
MKSVLTFLVVSNPEHADLIYRGIQPYTLIDRERFNRIYELMESVSELEGDIAELGVYKGGIAAGMALIAPGRILHLFDTFEGLPEPTYEEVHKKGEFSDTSPETVRKLFSDHALLKFHVGRFPESLTEETKQRSFSFVHVDGDYYETTRDALQFFYPRLRERGVMVFDDWDWVACPGVKRALLEAKAIFKFEISTAEKQAHVRKR